jgi:peptidoglycan/LPS O-acetylase OafA/YrhL
VTSVEEATGLESAAGPTSRFPALDGLRGLAALAVVTTHVGFQTGRTGRHGPVGWLLARGDFGVTVFFLLSGFLLYRPLSARPVRLGSYLRRRAFRVLPVYFVAVVLALSLLPENGDAGVATWVKHLLLVQVYVDTQLPDGLTQMWSLCTEVAFYLALPLIAAAALRLRRRRGQDVGEGTDLALLAGMLVLGVAWTAASARGGVLPPTANLWLPGYADWFALGMGLAVLHARVARVPEQPLSRALRDLGAAPGTCLAVALPLFLLAATALGGPRLLDPPTALEAVLKHVLYGFSALWLLLPVVFAPASGSAWTRVLTSRPLHAIGQVSYSLFALHLLLLYVVVEAVGGPFTGHFATVWLGTVALSLAASAVSFRLVERPMTRRGRG